MKKPKHKSSDSAAQYDPEVPVAKNPIPECEHDWQRDGQTMTSVRWTCTKCRKTKLNGLEV